MGSLPTTPGAMRRFFATRLYGRTLLLFLVAMLVGASPALAQAPQAPDRVRVLIAFRQNPGPNEQALVRAFGGNIRYTYTLVPAIAATIPSVAIQPLRNNPAVVSVEPDGEVYALDAELQKAWGVQHIGAGTVHATGNLGTGITVAIIDTGIDYTHSDLIGNVRGGRDFVNDDDDPMDDHDHGTHVAGTVAAKDDGLGVVGVAPQADLYALKVLNASGSGNWSDTIAALQWVVDNLVPLGGTVVTNNSYGSGTNPGGTVQAAFDNSYAAGVLHVASAGNSGRPSGKGNTVGWPARYDSVIAVAATDQNDKRASFSSTGDAVELAAPGVAITSTVPGGGLATWNGTSMASPHVAGTAALIIHCGTVVDSNGDGHINDEVRAVLQQTADELGDPGRDPHYGFGLVDADEAATTCDITPPEPAVNVSLLTDQSSYDVSGEETIAALTAVVADETGAAIDGLLPGDFETTLDGAPVFVSFAPTATPGTYTGTLDISGLEGPDHTVSVTVTDAAGLSGTDTASFDIGPAPPDGSTIWVALPKGYDCSNPACGYSTSGGRDGDKHLHVTVQLSPWFSGAAVAIELRNQTTGDTWPGSGTTGTTGSVTFTLSNAPYGTYTTEVTGVSAPGYNWDGVTPPNSFTK